MAKLRGTLMWRLHLKFYEFEYSICFNISRTKHRTNLHLNDTVKMMIMIV